MIRIGNKEFNDIYRICVYEDGEILYVCDAGNLEEVQIQNGEVRRLVNGNTVSLPNVSPLVMAYKMNLERKDNFMLYAKRKVGTKYESVTDLFIHKSEIAVEELGEAVESNIDGEIKYVMICRLTPIGGYLINRVSYEDIEPDYELKDGEYISQLVPVESEGKTKLKIRRDYTELCESGIFIDSRNARVEKTDGRLKQEAIAEVISNKINRIITHKDVQALQSVLNISVK